MAEPIRFYLDEHVPKAVARGLRQRGVDAVTVAELGMQGCTDLEHLQKAKGEGRVIFTHDQDFLAHGAKTPDHAGIVFASEQKPIGAVIAGLVLIHHAMDPSEMIGHVEFI
jgi:uncharacterized protein with PIN domain